MGATYDDCSKADADAAEQFAVAYVAEVGVSKETMIDAISTLRAQLLTSWRKPEPQSVMGQCGHMREGCDMQCTLEAGHDGLHVWGELPARAFADEEDLANNEERSQEMPQMSSDSGCEVSSHAQSVMGQFGTFEEWWAGYMPVRTSGMPNYIECAWDAWNAATQTKRGAKELQQWRARAAKGGR